MQSASDIFLGWFQGGSGRDYYVRQLRDAKISAVVEGFDLSLMQSYSRLCAWALARAHARSSYPATIAGYMGRAERLMTQSANFRWNMPTRTSVTRGFVAAIKEEAAADV